MTHSPPAMDTNRRPGRLVAGLVIALLVVGCATEPSRQSPGPTASPPPVMPTAAATPARSPAAVPSPTAAPASPTAMPTLTPVSAPDDGLGTWQVVKGSALVASQPLAIVAGERGVLLLWDGVPPGQDVLCEPPDRDGPGTAASFYDARTHSITRVKADVQLREFGAAPLPDGRVMVAGGYGPKDDFGRPTRRTRIWDPRSGRWSEGARMAVGRSNPNLVRLTDGRVMAIGGSVRDEDCEGCETDTSVVELYDAEANRWTRTAPLELTDSDELEMVTALADGRVLALGANESAALYEPATGLWTTIAPPDFWTAPIPLPDGTVVGFGSNSFAERFDPGRSSTVIGHWAPPDDAAAAVLPDGRVFFAGGSVEDDTGDRGKFLANAWIFDPGTGRVSEIASMPNVRAGAVAVALDDGSVLVAGGVDLWQTWTGGDEGGDDTPHCVPIKYRVVRWVP